MSDTETCSECDREVKETMRWGDRGEMPGVCMKCYFNPGWYRKENDQ